MFEALRGASSWLDYFTVGGHINPGTWILVSSSILILATSVVTALGLAGLCKGIPERLFLATSLTFGVVAIAAGYAGPAGGLFSHGVQNLLQGSLQPFRNVEKFAPDVALPIILGFAWVLSEPPWSRVRKELSKFIPSSSTSFRVLGVCAVVAVALAAAPYWRGELYAPTGFKGIPRYWSQAASWLDGHQGNGNVLIVPGANAADFTWGDTGNEPLSVLSDDSVEWRNLVPLGSTGYIQMLDAVEQTVDFGTPSPGLSQFLARGGVKYVVEQNDLNLNETGAPPPAVVDQVLSGSPGLTRVASFGPVVPPQQVQFGTLPVYDSSRYSQLRAVEIYRVDSMRSVVSTYSAADPLVVSGDAGSLLPLTALGVTDGRASVLAGDVSSRQASAAPKATWVITDGNQRRDASFGSMRNNSSYLLGRDQTLPGANPDIPLKFSVVSGVQHQTVEDPIGAASVSASTYGSSVFLNEPSEGPGAAFDGNPRTAWVAQATDNSVGQWISITFNRSLPLRSITITPLVGPAQRPSIKQLTISTARGSVVRDLPARAIPIRLSVPPGPSSYLTIRIDAVRPTRHQYANGTEPGAGITNIAIPGVRFSYRMLVPNDEKNAFSGGSKQAPIVMFTRPSTNPNLSLLESSFFDDEDMARQFSVPREVAVQLHGYAVPQPGKKLEQLLDVVTPRRTSGLTVAASASSWLNNLPRFRPYNLVSLSGDPWIANFGDRHPTIRLTWNEVRSVDTVTLQLTSDTSRPTEVRISGPSGRGVLRSVPEDGAPIHFPALVTKTLRIQIVRSAPKVGVLPNENNYLGTASGLIPATLPVGLQDVEIPGITKYPFPPLNTAEKISLPCGSGPSITLDGTVVPTSVSGSVGDLLDLGPMSISSCPSSRTYPLAQGAHQFTSNASGSVFAATSVVIQDPPSSNTSSAHDVSPAKARTAEIRTWTDQTRTLHVGAGSATYLMIAQNYNNAWVAKLGNQTLKPVRLDGWQQGYLVPAGKAGTITMTVAPAAKFDVLLLLGGLFVALLLVLALIPARRPPQESAGPTDLPSWWWLFGGALIALALVSGPVALVLVPLLWIAQRRGPRVMPAFAFGAFLAAGVFAAWSPAALSESASEAGAFGLPAQVASVVAVASVLSALIAHAKGFPRSESAPVHRVFAEPQPHEPAEEDGPSSRPVELVDYPEVH